MEFDLSSVPTTLCAREDAPTDGDRSNRRREKRCAPISGNRHGNAGEGGSKKPGADVSTGQITALPLDLVYTFRRAVECANLMRDLAVLRPEERRDGGEETGGIPAVELVVADSRGVEIAEARRLIVQLEQFGRMRPCEALAHARNRVVGKARTAECPQRDFQPRHGLEFDRRPTDVPGDVPFSKDGPGSLE